MPRTPLELPPALRTRSSNRGRVVGAPDMPRPKRSHEEVVEEKAERVKVISEAQEKQTEAVARAAAIEEASGEATEICQTSQHGASSTQQQGVTTTKLTVKLPLFKGRPKPVAEPGQIVDIEMIEDEPEQLEDYEQAEVDEFEDDVQPVIDLSEDEYQDSAAGESEAQGSSDDGVESILHLGPSQRASTNTNTAAASIKNLGKVGRAEVDAAKVVARLLVQSQSTAAGVGKRKQAVDAVAPVQSATKKAKIAKPQTALIPNWESIVKTGNRGRQPPPSLVNIPATASETGRSSSAISSTASAAPSSSDINTIASEREDDCFLSGSERNDNIDIDNAPDHNQQHDDDDIHSSTHVNYRERQTNDSLLELHSGQTGEQRRSILGKMAGIQAKSTVLTRVIPRTTITPSTRAAGKPTAQTSTRPVEDVADAGPVQKSKRAVRGSGKRPKSKISDLPRVIREPFNSRFVPLVRQFLGTVSPWQEITLSELCLLHRKAFGEELSAEYPLEEGDDCFRLIHYRIDDWHSKFGATALETFEEIVRDPENAAVLTGPEQIGTYAEFLLGDRQKKAPFYWHVWEQKDTGKPEGRLQSDLIIGTFAYHISELQTVDPGERTQEFAEGALTMSVTHVLSHYITGEFAPPKGRLGWFSEDNYSDRIIFQEGRNVWDRRMTRILSVVKNLKDSEWTSIYESAYTVVHERVELEKKRRGKKHVVSAAAGPGAGAVEEANDLMLVDD